MQKWLLEEAYCEPPALVSQTGFDDFRMQMSIPVLTAAPNIQATE